MKIGILSQDIRLYSTKRLYDTAIKRGHDTEVVSYLRCYMNIAKAKPRIFSAGRELNYDSVIPRIAATWTFYGAAVVRQFELMGSVSANSSAGISRSRDKLRASEDFESLNTRYEDISTNIEELNTTKKELLKYISEIEEEIKFRIENSFNTISVNFEEVFEKLFPGGKGSLTLTNPENLLESGIEISVQPRGKKVKKLSLLSGGERSLAAIAFLFSVFKSFPSPFYILDEVEAALDDANLHRMLNLLEFVKEDAQFLIVTHQQQTMQAGDVLYGVTMQPGSGSRVFTKTKKEFETLITKGE
ncbi:AAA family ATPase [bacterium]|nr:AAA family ATPase [bacterium]